MNDDFKIYYLNICIKSSKIPLFLIFLLLLINSSVQGITFNEIFKPNTLIIRLFEIFLIIIFFVGRKISLGYSNKSFKVVNITFFIAFPILHYLVVIYQ